MQTKKFKYKLQAIRVPAGWSVSLNTFFECPLTAENAEWFYGSVLFGASDKDYAVEICLEPEGDPNGKFQITLLKKEKSGVDNNIIWEPVLLENEASKDNAIAFLENCMYDPESAIENKQS